MEPRSARRGTACFTAASAPQNRTANRFCASANLVSVSGRPPRPPQSPAVNTRWSRAPTFSKKAATSLSVFTSMAWPDAPAPSLATAASTFCGLLDPITTSAPSASAALATAKPMPDEPPMTTMR